MTQEQNTMVEKMIKGPKIIPFLSHYAESNAVAIKAIYYGINMKWGKKQKKDILPLIKPLNNYKK